GSYRELLNSDAKEYGGSGFVNANPMQAEQLPWQGQPWSIQFDLPPLAAVYLGQ
ncbi:MAG: alpha amylase C-terminal domain-containing protein, partial [Verrucomicrobiales bacterium]|nr:alpha amylase C-terminal domain-containing protein [Verrucomicrobiales bacterium]